MKKGDCFTIKYSDGYFAIINHHSNSKDEGIQHGFVIVGNSYPTNPCIEEIELSKILGYKFVNKTSDLINSIVWVGKERNLSKLYTGIKYDLLSIPESVFEEESNRILKIGNVDLHPEFFPQPEFYARVSNYEKLVSIILGRISKKNPSKVDWNRYYDSFELKEILNKK